MKALYRVSDGFIFNAPCNENKLTPHENQLIEDGVWGLANIPGNPNVEHPTDYKINNGKWEILPEDRRPSFARPKNIGGEE